MTLTPQFLAEIRARTTLSALIGRSIKLTKAGREFKACCPFHNEKTPSFTVNDDKGFWHCFGCSAHGDALRWLTDYQGLPFLEAVAELVDATGLVWPDGVARPSGSASPRKPVERMPERQRDDDPFVSSEDIAALICARVTPADKRGVASYLFARNIHPLEIGARLADIAFCPNAPIRKWRLDRSPNSVPHAPAMVARLRRPAIDLPSSHWPVTGLHVTYLNDDCTGKMERYGSKGQKLQQRKMFGDVQGSCVVMGEYQPAVELVVGEGIESTFSGLRECELEHLPCALAALSLNNLQGYPLLDARGALPVWDLKPDMARDALWFAHAGPVTVLVDADMKATPVRTFPNSDRPAGPKVAERRYGPYVIRGITTEERAQHCGVLAMAGWKSAGAIGPVRALRPRLGMDFNDQGRMSVDGLAVQA